MQGMSTAEWSAYLTEAVGVPGRAEEVATTVTDHMAARHGSRPPLLRAQVKPCRTGLLGVSTSRGTVTQTAARHKGRGR
jgi:hypothetical protein